MTTKGTFEPATGGFVFESADRAMTIAPPGDYVFEITAIVGVTESTVQFTLTLVNPCFDQVALTIIGPHFEDKSYDLGAVESF